MKKIKAYLSFPTDTSSLIFLRITFGLLMLWELSRYFSKNWIKDLYIKQDFHFKYEWFTWVSPIPGNGMHFIFVIMMICSIFVTLGLFYRTSISLFFLLYTYVFLIDQAYYNNHFYLICIFSFLMIFTPLHHSWSLDCYRGAIQHKLKLPAIWLWLMRFPMTMVYVYGAIAKMESDWLSGKATRELFRRANAETFLEPLMNLQWTPIFYAWSGMLFDLLIPFAVLWKKTRIPAFTAAILFHVNNFIVFPIGVFPLLSLALTAIYFNPDFPKKLIPNWLKNNMYQLYRVPNQGVMHKDDNNMWPHNWLIGFLVLFIFFQLILPFRHHLYPGETKWHQVGHYFAWRMMLRQKLVEIRYNVIHPTTGEKRYAPLDDYLNPSQIRSFAGNPDMNLQFAHHLKKLVITHGGFVPVINADILVSLNGRDKQKLVNENLDLGRVDLFTPSYIWIEKFIP